MKLSGTSRCYPTLPPKSPHSKKSKAPSSKVKGGSVASASGASKRSGSSNKRFASTALDFSDEDDFEYSDADESAAAPASVKSNRSASSSGTNRRLPANVDKALLQDITAAGGRDLFGAGHSQGLCNLLDNPARKEIYGKRGNPIREKLGKRVQYLRRLSTEKYQDLLVKYDIKVTSEEKQAAAARKKKAKLIPTAVGEEEEEPVSDLEGGTVEEYPQPDVAPSSSILRSPQPDVAPSSKSSLSYRPVIAPSSSSKTPTMAACKYDLLHVDLLFNPFMFGSNLSFASSSTNDASANASIVVDLESWSQAEGLKVCMFYGKEVNGWMYDGVEISIAGDTRDFTEDLYI